METDKKLTPDEYASDALELDNEVENPPLNYLENLFQSLHQNIQDEALLNIPRAQASLQTVQIADKNHLYYFQQALGSKSTPQAQIGDNTFHMLSSYDYLGLIGHPKIETAAINAIKSFGSGTGGVRLLTGSMTLHHELEQEIANFKKVEAAVTYTSGYAANLAIISALMSKEDIVIADKWIHNSTVEACKLANVPLAKFEHNNMEMLEALLKEHAANKRVMVITEGIFSMDGDIGNLPEIVDLKNKYNAFLMVDEAHSLGVLGQNGRGVDEHFGIPPTEIDIFSGSLSKTIPSNGGFIAGSKKLIIYLQHASAPYIFSSALAPPLAAAAKEALNIIQKEKYRLTNLKKNRELLAKGLNALGFNIGKSETAVIPVILGENEYAYLAAKQLFKKGFLATPVIYPAVSKGKARLRLCVTAAQDEKFIERTLAAFKSLAVQ